MAEAAAVALTAAAVLVALAAANAVAESAIAVFVAFTRAWTVGNAVRVAAACCAFNVAVGVAVGPA